MIYNPFWEVTFIVSRETSGPVDYRVRGAVDWRINLIPIIKAQVHVERDLRRPVGVV